MEKWEVFKENCLKETETHELNNFVPRQNSFIYSSYQFIGKVFILLYSFSIIIIKTMKHRLFSNSDYKKNDTALEIITKSKNCSVIHYFVFL